MNFGLIGLLIAFREIWICILEVPTGAIADVTGRRKAMIFSFISYIISFIVFVISKEVWSFFPAMFFFAIGEAFRTGTHKAIIFDWLKHENRTDDKTEVYGYTRSWSKIGSASSLPVAAGIVYFTGNYTYPFLVTIIPYLLNIINFYTYPDYLDKSKKKPAGTSSIKHVFSTLLASLKQAIIDSKMRRIMLESMNYEGLYRTTKDYLQPIIKTFALSLAFLPALKEDKRTAIVIGVVYIVLYLLSSVASRHTGKFAKFAGGEIKASRLLWVLYFLTFFSLGVCLYLQLNILAIIAFVIIAVLQNFWRPILISRCATLAKPEDTATILSIESQAKTIFTAIMAPIIGWSIDYSGLIGENFRFLPVALLGILIPTWMLLSAPSNQAGK